MKLTCVFLFLGLMTPFCGAENETALRGILPEIITSIMDFFSRLEAFTKDGDVDAIIRGLQNKVGAGGQSLLHSLGQCSINGAVQYMVDHKDTPLGQLGPSIGVTDEAAKEGGTSALTTTGVVMGLVMKLFSSATPIDYTELLKNVEEMFFEEVPRVCARDPELSEHIKGIQTIILKIKDLGLPWVKQPGA